MTESFPHVDPASVLPRSQEVQAAEAEMFRARAKAFEAEARKTDIEARGIEVDARLSERAIAEGFAGNRYHHVYRFDSGVDSKTVAVCMMQLDIWDRLDPGCDTTIIFSSFGGDVVSGMAMFDYLLEYRARGHVLTTHVQGMAASMAGILLQTGDVRQMGREAYILVHQVQANVVGAFGEIEDRVIWLKMVQSRILDIFAKRTKLSKTELEKRWVRKDWWLDSDEAKKLGFVDKVV